MKQWNVVIDKDNAHINGNKFIKIAAVGPVHI